MKTVYFTNNKISDVFQRCESNIDVKNHQVIRLHQIIPISVTYFTKSGFATLYDFENKFLRKF